MPKLLVVHCRGLSFGLATRGDRTFHIVDLIAGGGIASVAPGGNLPGYVEGLDKVPVLAGDLGEPLPEAVREALADPSLDRAVFAIVSSVGSAEDVPPLDALVGECAAAARAAGARMVLLSDVPARENAAEEDHAVFIAGFDVPELRPGKRIRVDDVRAILERLAT